MEINSNASKLVKPSTPTPSILRNYNISFFDEQIPNLNVPLILCYNASQNDNPVDIFNRLEISLSKTLTDIYPMAGRYIRQGSFIDCSDQGALYVQAKANFTLSEFLSLEWALKLTMMMRDFLPCAVGAAGEADDPILSVKVTTFECGTLAIGMCIAHKFSDMSTICTFIHNWALRSQDIVDESALSKCSPIFSFPQRFPKRGVLDKTPVIPRSTSIGDHNLTEVFSFKGSAISKMREKLICKDNMTHRPSKVQLIVTLLWKALASIDRASDGQPKMSVAFQAVNLRDKIVPKLPDNSCGNIVTSTIAQIEPDNENIDFQGLYELLHDSINEIKDTCATPGDKENEYERLLELHLKRIGYPTNKDVNFYYFSSWCNFSFYKADFGWGKSVWRGTGGFPVPNTVVMMDDQEGDGVEAWVYLDEKRMRQLKQDPHIMTYAT